MHLTESEWFGQVNTAHQTWRQATAPTGYANDGGQPSRGRLRAQREQKQKSAFWLKPLSCCVLSTGCILALVCFPGVNLDERSTLLYMHARYLALSYFIVVFHLFLSGLFPPLSFQLSHLNLKSSFYWKGISCFICIYGGLQKTQHWKLENLELTRKLKDFEKFQKLHRYHTYYNMNKSSSTVIEDLLLYI